MEVTKKHVLLLRHGETPGNREHRYIGCRTDEPLSPEGAQKLRAMAAPLAWECPFDLTDAELYTGPMLRCRETAGILFPDREVQLLQGMTEMDFGRFEGKNYADLNGDPDYQRWIDEGGTGAFPEGETRDAFICRSMEAFSQLLRRSGGNAVLVCHGGNIMAILHRLTGLDYFDFQLSNGQGYALTLELTGEFIHGISYHRLCTGLSS